MKAADTKLYRHLRAHPPVDEDGRPRRGNGVFAAYWRGREGIGTLAGRRVVDDDRARCPYIGGSPAAIAWYAGRDARRELIRRMREVVGEQKEEKAS